MRGNTKFDIFPIFTPLNAVKAEMDGSIGRRSLRHLNALSQNAKAPAAIDSAMNSHLQALTLLQNSVQSTSRKEKYRSTKAKPAERQYFNILDILLSILIYALTHGLQIYSKVCYLCVFIEKIIQLWLQYLALETP